MSATEAGATRLPDATEKLRELRDGYLSIWSKSLIETVNSEGYAKASGAALDGLLAVAAPLKEPTEQFMLKTLQQLNMPTSADFASLSGRFTNMELLMDNLDAKLDRIEKLLHSAKAAPAPAEKQAVPAKSAASEAKVEAAEATSADAKESFKAAETVAKTAARSAPAETAAEIAPELAPETAAKAVREKRTALRASGTLKRIKTVKPVRKNAKKEVR